MQWTLPYATRCINVQHALQLDGKEPALFCQRWRSGWLSAGDQVYWWRRHSFSNIFRVSILRYRCSDSEKALSSKLQMAKQNWRGTQWQGPSKPLQTSAQCVKYSVTGQSLLSRTFQAPAVEDGQWMVSRPYIYCQHEKFANCLVLSIDLSWVASVKPEDFIEKSLRLNHSLAAREPYDKHLVGVRSVFQIYDVPVQEVLDASKQSSEGIREGVDAVLCYPPYNTRQIVELTHYDSDSLRLIVKIVLVDVRSRDRRGCIWLYVSFCISVQDLIESV